MQEQPNQGHLEVHANAGGEPYILNKAENGETLSASEAFASGHRGVIGNIMAHLQLFGGQRVKVIDYTKPAADEYIVQVDGGIFRESQESSRPETGNPVKGV